MPFIDGIIHKLLIYNDNIPSRKIKNDDIFYMFLQYVLYLVMQKT